MTFLEHIFKKIWSYHAVYKIHSTVKNSLVQSDKITLSFRNKILGGTEDERDISALYPHSRNIHLHNVLGANEWVFDKEKVNISTELPEV